MVLAGAVNGYYSSFYYYLFFYALNLGLFYSHANLIMPLFSLRDPLALLRFLAVLFVELSLYLMISVCMSLFLEYVIHSKSNRPLVFGLRYFLVVLYRSAFFIAYATGFFYLKDHLKREKDEMKKAIETEQLQAQLLTVEKDYLRAQINPHLLYNTLGFIKVASKRSPDQSDDAIDLLTMIMDYAMENSKEAFVPLSREVAQIENMITLNQLRYDKKLNLCFNHSIYDHQQKILPIILLTLVENLFKHGNLLDESKPASIELTTTPHGLIFWTRNLKGSKIQDKRPQTGIKNIEQRLLKSYTNKYQFSCISNEEYFETKLKIQFSLD